MSGDGDEGLSLPLAARVFIGQLIDRCLLPSPRLSRQPNRPENLPKKVQLLGPRSGEYPYCRAMVDLENTPLQKKSRAVPEPARLGSSAATKFGRSSSRPAPRRTAKRRLSNGSRAPWRVTSTPSQNPVARYSASMLARFWRRLRICSASLTRPTRKRASGSFWALAESTVTIRRVVMHLEKIAGTRILRA
jgi:hypothetical protein